MTRSVFFPFTASVSHGISNIAQTLFMAGILTLSGTSSAQVVASTPTIAVIVNGTSIQQSVIDSAVLELVSKGAKDTPQLRDQLLLEFIAREALVSEATRQGLDKTATFQRRLNETKRGMLMESVVLDYLAKNPISEAEERSEYDRQVTVLGGENAQQYLLSHIVVADEAQARMALSRLKKKEAFDKVAAAMSTDEATKAKGGQLGWVLPSEVVGPIATVIVNLSKGSVTAAPIQTAAGWQVVKVDDIRPFKIPTFTESRPQVIAALQNMRRRQLIADLLKSAELKKP